MSEYESNLVKCFSNSDLGVNLTTILIDMEPWFIAKEVALTLGYVNTNQAINDNVDERDQKMLSYGDCKELFANITDAETIENTDNSRGIRGGTSGKLNICKPTWNEIHQRVRFI